MSHSTLSIFAAGLLCAGAGLFAQGTLRGTVKDPQGLAVDGAEVALFQKGSAAALGRARSVKGEFAFAQAPGDYLLEVSADGFRRVTAPASGPGPFAVTLQVAGLDQRVVVTAEGAAQTVDEVSKASTTIGAAEIAERNEYSLTEVLRDVPGMLVRHLGGPGQGAAVRIRGLRAEATSVLIDGMRFRDVASIQGDASSFLSTFNVINFDRVEVLRGSGSSLYGTNAVGGTVNVVTDPGGGPVHGSLQAEGGGLGLMRGRGTVSGGARDNRLTYSAGLLHLNVLSGIDGDDRMRSTGVQSFARYLLGAKTSVSGRVFFSDDFTQLNASPSTSGIPAANIPATGIVPAIPFTTFVPGKDDPDSRRASRFWSGAWTVRQQLHATADWQASYQRVHTKRHGMNGPAGPGFQPLTSTLSDFTGTIDTVDTKVMWRPRSWYSLTGGYEFEREGYLNVDDNRMPAPATVATRTEAAQRSHAAYFANQMTFAKLQISFSGRAQGFALDVPRFVYAGILNGYAKAAVATAPRALTGDVALSYFVTRTGTKLRAHGGNSYRAPGLYERYGSGFYYSSFSNAVVYSPYGDPRLAPDRYNSVDAGLDQYLMGSRVRLSATVFYTRIVQITQFDSSANSVKPASDPFGRFSGYYNGAGGITRGVELTAEARPRRGTVVRGSYSYTGGGTDQDSGVRGYWGILGVPKHAAIFFVNQQLGKKTDVTVDLYHSSDYVMPFFAGTRTRAFLAAGMTKMDAVINRTLWRGEKYSLRGYAKVDNVFNQRYYENGFQAPRATFLTGLQVMFR